MLKFSVLHAFPEFLQRLDTRLMPVAQRAQSLVVDLMKHAERIIPGNKSVPHIIGLDAGNTMGHRILCGV